MYRTYGIRAMQELLPRSSCRGTEEEYFFVNYAYGVVNITKRFSVSSAPVVDIFIFCRKNYCHYIILSFLSVSVLRLIHQQLLKLPYLSHIDCPDLYFLKTTVVHLMQPYPALS